MSTEPKYDWREANELLAEVADIAGIFADARRKAAERLFAEVEDLPRRFNWVNVQRVNVMRARTEALWINIGSGGSGAFLVLAGGRLFVSDDESKVDHGQFGDGEIKLAYDPLREQLVGRSVPAAPGAEATRRSAAAVVVEQLLKTMAARRNAG